MIKPKETAPELHINLVNGTTWMLSDQSPDLFTMLLFYRGKHCPLCKKQLEALQNKRSEFTDRDVNIIAISSDNEDVAKATYEEWDIDDIPLGYGFSIDDAREWGLFISEGIKDEPEYFTEPGFFLVKPDRTIHWESIQSMPFARPTFDHILKGIDYIKKEDYPARGEA